MLRELHDWAEETGFSTQIVLFVYLHLLTTTHSSLYSERPDPASHRVVASKNDVAQIITSSCMTSSPGQSRRRKKKRTILEVEWFDIGVNERVLRP